VGVNHLKSLKSIHFPGVEILHSIMGIYRFVTLSNFSARFSGNIGELFTTERILE